MEHPCGSDSWSHWKAVPGKVAFPPLCASNFSLVSKNPKFSLSSTFCYERWTNHLNPAVVKGSFTPEEDSIIIKMQKEVEAHSALGCYVQLNRSMRHPSFVSSQIGNQWALISKHLPGRTDNAVKNRFHSCMRSKGRCLLENSSSRNERASGTEDWSTRKLELEWEGSDLDPDEAGALPGSESLPHVDYCLDLINQPMWGSPRQDCTAESRVFFQLSPRAAPGAALSMAAAAAAATAAGPSTLASLPVASEALSPKRTLTCPFDEVAILLAGVSPAVKRRRCFEGGDPFEEQMESLAFEAFPGF